MLNQFKSFPHAAVRNSKSLLRKFFVWLSVFSLLAPGFTPMAMAAATITTNTTVVASSQQVVVGDPIVLTASVAAQSGSGPTGTVTFKRGTTTLGTATLAGSGLTQTATFTTALTTAGANSITAVYVTDGVNKASTSPAVSVNALKFTPVIGLTSNLASTSVGTPVTFTAVVTGYAIPTGLVTFMDGATVLGTKSLSGTGDTKTAAFATTALGAGVHNITATYAGDSVNEQVSSNAIVQTVDQKSSSTVLTSSTLTLTYGNAVTFTAKVTGASPSGLVTFMDDQTVLGTGSITAGVVSFTTSNLSISAHAITAVYGGDASNLGSTSNLVNQLVKSATSATLESNLNPATAGDSVTFKATFSGTTEGGTVTFKDGSTTLGTATISGGIAWFTTDKLKGGLHPVTVLYAGNAVSNAATSSAVGQVVNLKQSTVTLSTSANPALASTPVTLTAIVTGNLPTGNVNFSDNGYLIGTGKLSGTTVKKATLKLNLEPGVPHVITADYVGDASNASSTSSALNQTVLFSTQTVLTADQGGVSIGSPIALTAFIYNGNALSGTVTFKKGAIVLGTAAVTDPGDGTGNATATLPNLVLTTVGVNNITAVFSGDIRNSASTSTVFPVTIYKSGTDISLAASANPVGYADKVSFVATVTGFSETGRVSFMDGGVEIGRTPLVGTGNTKTATFTSSVLAAGSHDISAVYIGDTKNDPSNPSNVIPLVVKAKTEPWWTFNVTGGSAGDGATSANIAVGDSIGLWARVENSISSSDPELRTTGTIGVYDNGKLIGTLVRDEYGDWPSIPLKWTAPATHRLTAKYSGDINNSATTTASPIVVTVAKAQAQTLLSTQVTQAVMGRNVSITATVEGYLPTGTVILKDVTNGAGVNLGTATVSNGSAAFTVKYDTVGIRTLRAIYSGDTNNAVGTANDLVLPIVGVVTVQSSANPVEAESPVTLMASVSGSSPSGSVTFMDGSATLGTATLTSGLASLSVPSLTFGGHSITAYYSGDSSNPASYSEVFQQSVVRFMTWQYGYDAVGRLVTSIDPNGLTTNIYYDSLGRAIQKQEPASPGSATPTITSTEYSLADHVIKVTDPRNLPTIYSPDGFGRVMSTTSPDTGLTGQTYDNEGKNVTTTDARGKAANMTYDSLGRLKTVSFPSGAGTAFEYDGGAVPIQAAIGKLTKVMDESGSLSYSYDSAARLSTKTQVTNGKIFTVGYTWGDAGSSLDKVTAVIYPSGNRVNYTYDADGTVSAVTVSTVNANGVGVSGSGTGVLSGITTNAFGAVTGWNWTGGLTFAQGFDLNGFLINYSMGPAQTRTLARDSAGRITGYKHSSNAAALDQIATYDNLNRLTAVTLAGVSTSYNYDASNNRTSKVVNGTTYTNAISPTSNRQVTVQDVGGTFNFTYDAAGHVISDGVNTFAYSDRGRMSSATTAAGTVNYLYNALEQRVHKAGTQVPTGAAYFVYDEGGKVIGEYDANGAPIYETVYLGMTPVAVLKQTGTAGGNNIAVDVYNVHADHLAAPRVITRQSDNAIVWRWDSAESFGGSAPDQNPFGQGTFVYNQRFPGQVFDAETGLFDNWNRTYDARQGRYRQSDPIGLGGGINTYAYVGGNPLWAIDPDGLAAEKIDGNRVTVHKNDVDPWPSDPHGHVYDKNQVIDKDGKIYDKTTGKEVGQLSKKGLTKWLEFLKRIGKLGLIGDLLFFKDWVDQTCQAVMPGNPFCGGEPPPPCYY